MRNGLRGRFLAPRRSDNDDGDGVRYLCALATARWHTALRLAPQVTAAFRGASAFPELGFGGRLPIDLAHRLARLKAERLAPRRITPMTPRSIGILIVLAIIAAMIGPALAQGTGTGKATPQAPGSSSTPPGSSSTPPGSSTT